MKKVDKAIPEEIPIEEAPGVIQELVASAAAAEPKETVEQREERLKREDYARRNIQAIKDREDILRRNGVLKPDEPFSMDPEAAVNQRCCI
jgi:hypothetical protein